MLREITIKLGRAADEYYMLRSFVDLDHILSIAYDYNRKILFFDLTYNFTRKGTECYHWRRNEGLTHYKVETGDNNPTKNMTPIMCRTLKNQHREFMMGFAENLKEVDPTVRKFVISCFMDNPSKNDIVQIA